MFKCIFFGISGTCDFRDGDTVLLLVSVTDWEWFVTDPDPTFIKCLEHSDSEKSLARFSEKYDFECIVSFDYVEVETSSFF